MRAINFTKIDYIRTRQQMYFIPLIYLIAIFMGVKSHSIMVGLSYMAFLSMTFATASFGTCQAKDAGFLVLLPSTTRDRVLGRFLYGISFMVMSILVSGILILINRLMGKEMESWMPAISLFILAICIFNMALEFLLLYLAGERMASNLQGVVRVIPGMVLFFFAMWAIGRLEDGQVVLGVRDMSMLSGMSRELMLIGVIALVIALVVLAAAVMICIKVMEKRDYV